MKTQKTLISIIVVLLLIGFVTIAVLQSRRPSSPVPLADENAPPGVTTVTMMIDLMETQLGGFGGWIPNDIFLSPSFYLDNLPSFQLGVLQVLRHDSRVLRDNLTRQRTSDAVHKDTDLAYSAFANDPHKWAFPSAESAFGRGVAALKRFRKQLGTKDASFYPRADNLVQLLEPLVSELGAVTTVLLSARNPEKVGWMDVDDNFYFAQGVGYALLGTMQAVRQDFREVVTDKKATEIMDLIVDSLEASQFDPLIVTNGSKAGILASHSNNVRVYLDDARQKMNSLISILKQG